MTTDNLYLVNNTFLSEFLEKDVYRIFNPMDYDLHNLLTPYISLKLLDNIIKNAGTIDELTFPISSTNLSKDSVEHKRAMFMSPENYLDYKNKIEDSFKRFDEDDILSGIDQEIKNKFNTLEVIYNTSGIKTNCSIKYIDSYMLSFEIDFTKPIDFILEADMIVKINIDHHNLNRLKFNEEFYNKIYQASYVNVAEKDVRNTLHVEECFYTGRLF